MNAVSPQAEQAAQTVTATVEAVVEGAQAAVDAANARAENAEAAAAAVVEGMEERETLRRISELEEELVQCQSQVEDLEGAVQSLQTQNQATVTALQAMTERLETMTTRVTVATPAADHSSSNPHSPNPETAQLAPDQQTQPAPDQTVVMVETNQPDASADDRPAAAPAPAAETKRAKFRLT